MSDIVTIITFVLIALRTGYLLASIQDKGWRDVWAFHKIDLAVEIATIILLILIIPIFW